MLASRLKSEREKLGMNKKEISEQLGIPYTTYCNYEAGSREPNSEMLKKIANYYSVTLDYLLGLSDINNSSHQQEETELNNAGFSLEKYGILPVKTKKIPMLGEIACGEPKYCNEEYETFIEASDHIDADFCLVAKGDSMINARIYNVDVVFIKRQPTVENGEIAAVIIDNEATLKRVYYYPDKNKLVLSAENPAYEPFIYTEEELNQIKILGKAIAFQSFVK